MTSLESIIGKYTVAGRPQSSASILHQLERTGRVRFLDRYIPSTSMPGQSPDEMLKFYARHGYPEDTASIIKGTNQPELKAKNAMSQALWKAAVGSFQAGIQAYSQFGTIEKLYFSQGVYYLKDFFRIHTGRINIRKKEREPVVETIRSLTQEDLADSRIIEEILSHWVVKPGTRSTNVEEVTRFLQAMADSVAGKNERKYIVAQTKWKQIVGILGYMPVSDKLSKFAVLSDSREIINVYADPYFIGSGVGKALLLRVEQEIKKKGFNTAILISSPRFMKSWPIYEKLGYRLVHVDEGTYNNQTGSHIYRKEII